MESVENANFYLASLPDGDVVGLLLSSYSLPRPPSDYLTDSDLIENAPNEWRSEIIRLRDYNRKLPRSLFAQGVRGWYNLNKGVDIIKNVNKSESALIFDESKEMDLHLTRSLNQTRDVPLH